MCSDFSLKNYTKFDFMVDEEEEWLNPSREKNEGTHRRKTVDEKSCMTPAGTSNELDVQNEWEENTHTRCSSTHTTTFVCSVLYVNTGYRYQSSISSTGIAVFN